MDWDLAIKRNSEALKEIIAGLFAMLELAGGITVARIPQLRPQRRAAGALARRIRHAAPDRHRGPRPCGEASARASGLASQACGSRSGKAGAHVSPSSSSIRGKTSLSGAAESSRGLNRASMSWRMIPRVVSLWAAPRPAPPPAKTPPSDGLVNAVPLTRRLEALKLALEDLPRQARRMARWRARRETMPSPKFRSPLRPGPPPGPRRKPIHLVDEVLIECHGLAWDALKPDTS